MVNTLGVACLGALIAQLVLQECVRSKHDFNNYTLYIQQVKKNVLAEVIINIGSVFGYGVDCHVFERCYKLA